MMVSVTFGRTMLDILQDAFEHTGDFSSTALEKFSGMSVTINRSAVGDAVSSGDLARAGPTDEVTFDGVAVGMGADDAAARVAGKIGRGGFSVKIEQHAPARGKWFLLGWAAVLSSGGRENSAELALRHRQLNRKIRRDVFWRHLRVQRLAECSLELRLRPARSSRSRASEMATPRASELVDRIGKSGIGAVVFASVQLDIRGRQFVFVGQAGGGLAVRSLYDRRRCRWGILAVGSALLRVRASFRSP